MQEVEEDVDHNEVEGMAIVAEEWVNSDGTNVNTKSTVRLRSSTQRTVGSVVQDTGIMNPLVLQEPTHNAHDGNERRSEQTQTNGGALGRLFWPEEAQRVCLSTTYWVKEVKFSSARSAFINMKSTWLIATELF